MKVDDLEELRPTSHRKIIELVEEAGIDVSDWANFKGGVEKASMNPKYCYEWSFEERKNNIFVLNLWFDNCEIVDGIVVQQLNLRSEAEEFKGIQKRRAFNMDFSLQNAARLNAPIRVIMCDENPKLKKPGAKSTADRRFLDPIKWYIKEYGANGDCVLQRGELAPAFIDQFSLRELELIQPDKQETITTSYPRSKAVREQALLRANGHCEYCGVQGFKTKAGSLYLESHHITPLSEGGVDHPSNVIALCPNHHREAHYSECSSELRSVFLEKIGN